MNDCLFCRIADGSVKSEIVYSDETVVAFKDISPQAPVHVQIIPRRHIPTLNDLSEQDAVLAGRLLLTGRAIAEKMKISGSGYRLVLNCNKDAGQAVFHVHCHLLGGRPFAWPPG